MEEVDGGEQEKEDEWVLTQEDYECEKEDMAFEAEGIEEGEVEQDVEVENVEAEEKKEEIPSKDEEIIPSKHEEGKEPEKLEVIEKKDHGGARPKAVLTVPVPFNTHTRSACKKEQDEIEKEIEKNIQ